MKPNLAQALDLLEVVEVVAGEKPRDGFDGFRAAFVVDAVLFPLRGGEGFKKSDVGFADGAVVLDGFGQVALFVMQGGDRAVVKRDTADTA